MSMRRIYLDNNHAIGRDRTEEYPFATIHSQYELADIICMVCGYRDVVTVFHPLRKQTSRTTHGPGTTTVNIDVPAPGTRNESITRCPMCLAKKERSLGDKIWNRL